MRVLLISALILVLGFVVSTYAALESDGVAVASTIDDAGAERLTHIWYAKSDGVIFLEAGNPSNGWVQDLDRGTALRLAGDELSGRFTYRIVEGELGQQKIRAMMRERYGWRDAWISMVFDVTNSRMVEVTPASDARTGGS